MLALLLAALQLVAPSVDCYFDPVSMQFAGSPREQAQCLLRHVEAGGNARSATQLPQALAALIGQPASIERAKLAAELRHRQIPLPATTPVSETLDHHRALYFVIHDTSAPWIGARDFPTDFDRKPRLKL